MCTNPTFLLELQKSYTFQDSDFAGDVEDSKSTSGGLSRTSFLDYVYFGCTQRECQISEDIVDNYKSMFESRISVGRNENYQNLKPQGNLRQTLYSSWSHDMEGHANKCVERYGELANKTTEQLYKVATPCLDDHQFKEEEIGSVGELSTVCSQIVLNVNKFARAVTTWTKLVINVVL